MVERKPRVDAVRNRARLLQVAFDSFASDGLTVPVDEIARRAGVGAGTVYRHFPTKDQLFAAIISDRLAQHTSFASEVAARAKPGAAFFEFLDWVVREGGADQGLMEALAGTDFDLVAAVPEAEAEWIGAVDRLLRAAHATGEVRSDLTVADLTSLVVGYQTMLRHRGDPVAADRLLNVLRAGLVPAATPTAEVWPGAPAALGLRSGRAP